MFKKVIMLSYRYYVNLQEVGCSFKRFGRITSYTLLYHKRNMMLMKSTMPSIINEGYFLTNDGRLNQPQTDYTGMVSREANAMARGLGSYYF